MVVRQGLTLGLLGVALGSVISILAHGLLEGFLFGVEGTGGPTLLAVSLGVLTVAAAASLIPAWRASAVDPLQTLQRQ